MIVDYSDFVSRPSQGLFQIITPDMKGKLPVQQMLRTCDNCGNATFEPMSDMFLKGARIDLHEDARMMEICSECVDALISRQGLYKLRDQIARPVRRVGIPQDE